MTEEKYIRRRINVSISVKGIKTWDNTLESNYLTEDELLEKSDSLVAQLEKRYPIKEEK